MTFEELQKANKTIVTVDVKGKQYAEVNQRIKAFRQLYPCGSIETEILSCENGVVMMRSTVRDDTGKVLGTGTAYEKESSSYINKTSYVENCETSAVGRALGMCGIGIDTSVASAEEVANAIKNQETEDEPDIFEEKATKEQCKRICDLAKQLWDTGAKEQLKVYMKPFGAEKTSELKTLNADKLIKQLEQL